MRILAVDSNSIMNRAYYGIKVLTTKDGFFTNAIYGFLNILLSAMAETKPDTVVLPLMFMRRPFGIKCLRNIRRAGT